MLRYISLCQGERVHFCLYYSSIKGIEMYRISTITYFHLKINIFTVILYNFFQKGTYINAQSK